MKKGLIIGVVGVLCTFGITGTVAEAGFIDGLKSVFSSRQKPKAPSIKVLVARNLKGATLEVSGAYRIYDAKDNDGIAIRNVGNKDWVQPLATGLKWGEEFPGVYQISMVPTGSSSMVSVNGVMYRGTVSIFQVDNVLYVVNEVPVEDYVASVLSAQNTDALADETLNALAIATRTDACYQALNSPSRFWNVDADVVGYRGRPQLQSDSRLAKAMATTEHLVLSSTRSFEGSLSPISTRLSEADATRVGSAWNLTTAEQMARRGYNASKILGVFFPNGTIEVMQTAPKTNGNKDAAYNTENIADTRSRGYSGEQ